MPSLACEPPGKPSAKPKPITGTPEACVRKVAIRIHLCEPPSTFGFKLSFMRGKENTGTPEELVAFYKQAGGQYLITMADQHDNVDLYNSKH